MMVDTTTLYNLVLVWMILTFIQGQFYDKLNLVSIFTVKLDGV